MFWRTIKAPNPTKLITATLGRAGFVNPRIQDYSRPRGDQLVRRYGMWVHRCTQINAQVAASVPFKLMRVASSPQAAKDAARLLPDCAALPARTKAYLRGRFNTQPSMSVRKRMHGNLENLVEVERHPLLDLLHDVNEWIDGFAFRESLYSDLQIFGRAFTHLIEDSRGNVTELWRMLPQKMTVVRDRVRFVSHFEMNHGADMERFDTDEVLWFRLFDPEDPWGGMGPLEAWLKTIDASLYIQEFQVELMKRFGSPDYIVLSEAPLSDDQKRAFRRDWRRLFGRMFDRRENIGFLSNSTIERLGQTQKELEFQASEDSKRDQIGQAFGVPKALLTTDDVNRANARETRTFHIENTIWPFIQRIEDTLNSQLVPRFGEGLFLLHENPIPDDETIRIEERKSKLQSGWSINELRIEEGLEPLETPDADMPLVVNTLTTLEKVAAEMEMAEAFAREGDPSADQEEEEEEEEEQEEERSIEIVYQPPPLLGQFAAKILEPAPLPQQPAIIPIVVQVPQGTTQPINLNPHILVQQPPAPQVQAAFNVEPPQVHMTPSFKVEAPIVNVEAPSVNPQFNVEAPIVNVEAPEVKAQFNVEAPIVNVEAPEVSVEPPKVDIQVAAPDVKVTPQVTVLPPDVKIENMPVVNVEPQVNVNVDNTVELPPRKITFERDSRGVIRGADVADAD